MECRMMGCKKCERPKYIVNKHFGLCQECNNERLHGSKFGKAYKVTSNKPTLLKSYPKLTSRKRKPKQRKSLFSPIKTDVRNRIDMYELDNIFYKKCFDSFNHRCEECNTELPDIFENEDGFVINRWRYSHIIPKSTAPELRHDINNINDLCLACHMEWENGDKKKMNIYKGNCDRLPQYF